MKDLTKGNGDPYWPLEIPTVLQEEPLAWIDSEHEWTHFGLYGPRYRDEY